MIRDPISIFFFKKNVCVSEGYERGVYKDAERKGGLYLYPSVRNPHQDSVSSLVKLPYS